MQINGLKSVVYRFWHILLLALLLPIFFVAATNIAHIVDVSNSDFFTFWLSGYLTSEGKNLYDGPTWIAGHHQFQANWIPNATFIYPVQIALLFVPLGILSPFQAYIVWNALLQLLIISSVLVIMNIYTGRWINHYYLPIIACVAIFRPTVVSLINGQISALLLFIVALIMVFWERGKWKTGAALMAFLALKPNLGVPIILLLSVYLILQNRTSSLAVGVASGLLLTLVGWLQNPNWIIDFWNAGNTKLSQIFGYAPNIWGVVTRVCGFNMNCAISIGGVFSLLIIAAYVLFILKESDGISPSLVVSLAVVIMLLVTPSCWPYDQVLLIAPITFLVLKLAKLGYPYLSVVLIFFALDIAAWALLGLAVLTGTDFLTSLVPFSVLCLIVWHIYSSRLIALLAT